MSALVAKKLLFRQALISSLPVLMGYLTMGFAAGVLMATQTDLRFSAFYGACTSATCISGTLQFIFVDWIKAAPRVALWDVALLTLCLNFRYALYGLSLLTRFQHLGFFKKAYLIWALTDETYALETESRITDPKAYIFYCTSLSALNHVYWILGVTLGCLIGSAVSIPSKGIEFAMVALFIVILTDQWQNRENHLPALVGATASCVMLAIFGVKNMLIPAMVLFMAIFLLFRKRWEVRT